MDHDRRNNDLLVGEMSAKIDMMMSRLDTLENYMHKKTASIESKIDDFSVNMNRGKGVVIGAVMLALAAGTGIVETLRKLF